MGLGAHIRLTSMNDVIEGELAAEEPGREVTTRDDKSGAVRVFNPLDAEPVAFTRQLQVRQDNYDNLRLHLFGVLVPGKDFGKIHVVKKCDNKYSCTNPRHWSGYELFAPGADKILGILGLSPAYPGYEDYIRAAVTGKEIKDVIIKCQILSTGDQVISDGMGACSRSEISGGNLNNTLKRACKRARVDAVKRLPTVSALFEDDTLAELEAAAKRNDMNSARKRTQRLQNRWDTGARLDVCPIGKDIKGKLWREIETDALKWIIAKVTDKPDVTRAAKEELSKRSSAPGSSSIRTPSSPASEPVPSIAPLHSDEPEVCSIHGCEMDGELCPECEKEQER